MEGSESEAVFDSFNLNPQLFLNEVHNAVDDVVDGAFDFYKQQASELLGHSGIDRSDELSQGIFSLRHMVQAVLDKRLGMWEKYCLRHCFAVPEGFSLPKAELSGNSSLFQDVPSDAELDAQLESLREKLVSVGRESVELNRELHALERQSMLSNSCAKSVAEALEQFEQNSVHEMFQEMTKAASELRTKMETLKTKRREEMERVRIERMYGPDKMQSIMYRTGLSASLEDLREFADVMKNM